MIYLYLSTATAVKDMIEQVPERPVRNPYAKQPIMFKNQLKIFYFVYYNNLPEIITKFSNGWSLMETVEYGNWDLE